MTEQERVDYLQTNYRRIVQECGVEFIPIIGEIQRVDNGSIIVPAKFTVRFLPDWIEEDVDGLDSA